MGPLDVVELQGPHDRLEHVLGDAAHFASLQLRVVLDADSGELRHLLAPQPRHAATAAVGAQARLLGRDPGPPRG